AGQSGDRPALHPDRSEDPLLSPPPAMTVPVEAVAAAPSLPDLWPPVEVRRGLVGFLRRHPTVAIGAALLILMMLMAVFAPYLWTVDPTALNTSRRTRAPSEL